MAATKMQLHFKLSVVREVESRNLGLMKNQYKSRIQGNTTMGFG